MGITTLFDFFHRGRRLPTRVKLVLSISPSHESALYLFCYALSLQMLRKTRLAVRLVRTSHEAVAVVYTQLRHDPQSLIFIRSLCFPFHV